MGILVDKTKCISCGNCVEICPGDLMALHAKTKKAFIRNQGDCWDCLSCVKSCPQKALQTKLPYTVANYKASLIPDVQQDKIKWTLTDINGNVEEFEIPTLTL